MERFPSPNFFVTDTDRIRSEKRWREGEQSRKEDVKIMQVGDDSIETGSGKNDQGLVRKWIQGRGPGRSGSAGKVRHFWFSP